MRNANVGGIVTVDEFVLVSAIVIDEADLQKNTSIVEELELLIQGRK